MARRIVRPKESSNSEKPESSPDFSKRNSNCEACGLWESAQSICLWGTGNKSARVMVVFEAPDSRVDAGGKHFQGPAGKLFQGLLDEAGIDPKDFYVTHLVKCHPPESASPSSADVKTCRPYLDQEISEVKPEFILTLGATALKGLTKKAKVTELHGQLQKLPNGVNLFPTFHPAMAIRDPGKLAPLRRDILKLGRLLSGEFSEDAASVEKDYTTIRTLKQWNSFVDLIKESSTLSVDLETTGLDRHAEGAAVNSIQITLDTLVTAALPLSARDSPWDSRQQSVFIDTLVELSEGKEVSGHNFKFDNLWLKTIYGTKFRLGFDTMLAHHVLDENSPHGLKELASEFCGAPSYDVSTETKLGRGNMEEFYQYGCDDTFYTAQLRNLFRAKLLKQPSIRRLFYKLVMPAARMFEDVEEDGLFINRKKLIETEKTLSAQRDALLKSLNKAAGGPINWNSSTQIAELFYNKLKLPILEKTSKGKPSTAETVLLRLQEKSPVAKLLMDYRGIEKNLSTYIVGWQELMHGDRLYLSTKLHGTVTGRFASRLHQVPRDKLIRSHIDAPPGWSFVCADYSQIELRLAAMLANDQRMKMIFQTGGDIHSSTASFILGKPESQLTKEERKTAKAVNFGLLYGMGWPKLVINARDNYGVDMTDEQAQQFRKRYFETYSALLPWHERQRRVVRAFGEVSSLSGRVRRLPGVNSSDKGVRAEAERQSINSPVQGFGSGDLKVMAMVEIHETFSSSSVRIKGEVHDSILMWVRTDKLNKLLPQVKKIMESPKLLTDFKINMTVPIIADFEVGPWGEGVSWKV